MICLRCDGTQFIEKNTRFNPEIKGKKLKVMAHCLVCKNCQFKLMTTEQMGFLCRAAADKYELLTSEQSASKRKSPQQKIYGYKKAIEG